MKRSTILWAGLVIITAGCKILTESEISSTLDIAPPLNPYQSTTRTPDLPTPTPPLSTDQPIIPTPTPFKHIIQAGETLYSIALKYNISLDKLASANPGLDTRILIIGSEVIIPFSEEDDLLVTPTPYPLLVGDPICYPTTDGSLWCYALLSNDLEIPLEDISLAINLFEEDQLPVMSQIAFPPVDILFPGQRIPAGTLIQAPPADLIRISTTLLSAYGSSQQGPGVQITDYSLTYSQGDTIAQVTGFFEIDSEDSPEGQVWIVGVALNEGKPVGVRKWVSAEGLEAGTGYPFELTLYSLGPEIDQVDLISELH